MSVDSRSKRSSAVRRATMITVDGHNDWCELSGEDEDDDMGVE